MVTTDPIADMLSRIRNAIAAGQTEITLPHSKTKQTVAEILVVSGFLKSTSTVSDDGRQKLQIIINSPDHSAPITEIERLSRPGRRLYVGAGDIPAVKRGRGIVVISTSHGVMTGQQAKSKNLGGELICKVY